MSTAMMMDRTNMMGMGMSAGAGPMSSASTMPTGSNMMMVPRCTVVMEKCPGGMKITCSTDDAVASTMIQNLCTMMAGGMCSCCCMMNGMMACCCNMTMAMCQSEMTDKGVCITCISGDKACAAMIQACCDCCTSMMKAGCTCCVMMNGMPVCCGC
jgi:hypothetical protein